MATGTCRRSNTFNSSLTFHARELSYHEAYRLASKVINRQNVRETNESTHTLARSCKPLSQKKMQPESLSFPNIHRVKISEGSCKRNCDDGRQRAAKEASGNAKGFEKESGFHAEARYLDVHGVKGASDVRCDEM